MTLLLVFHLFTLDKITVKGLHSTDVEPLACILNSSFQTNWEQNNTYQLQFTAYDDKSVAYDSIDAESSIYFDGQEYIVKQCLPDFSSGVATKQVTAIHIYNEVSRIRQRTIKTGTITYSINDVLAFYLSGNSLGFSYQVIGSFDTTQITDLGNSDGKDMLSKIVSAWPTAVIYPDNKVIRVYSSDAWAKNNGNRIDYLNNASEVKQTYDSSSITNQAMVYGKTKESDNTDATEYYFPPHLVSNQDSIDKWGLHPAADISDDRFTDSGAMDRYALTQLIPEPTLTIDVTYDGNEKPIAGELRRLEIREASFVTNVQVVAYTWYPLDETQQTQLTLNNTAKTILDYQNSHKQVLEETIESLKKASQQAQNAADAAKNIGKQINYTWTEADIDEWYGH
ncbi:phage tail protein [Latilactobacillus curvatus]|uniref:phage tail protein n=1 Tax=Latilactobacillus curvatus TaxID=28038 RepID=UPI0016453279|nr:phage tail protein [Latilactobacillus curvatus]